jgi:hypothetical protein
MLIMVSSPRQLAHLAGECVKCDSGSTVVRATRLIAGGGCVAPDGGARLPGEFSVTTNAFALGRVLHFGSLAYVTDGYGKLHPLKEVVLVDNKFLVPSSSPGLLGADLEVLAR